MYFVLNRLKKATTILLVTAVSMALVSCGDTQEDKPEDKPVEQPPKPPAPVVTAPAPDALDDFRTPNDDVLPTNAQLAEGAESSIGTVGTQPSLQSDSAPSTAAKPPTPAPKPDEDQLDPGE